MDDGLEILYTNIVYQEFDNMHSILLMNAFDGQIKAQLATLLMDVLLHWRDEFLVEILPTVPSALHAEQRQILLSTLYIAEDHDVMRINFFGGGAVRNELYLGWELGSIDVLEMLKSFKLTFNIVLLLVYVLYPPKLFIIVK